MTREEREQVQEEINVLSDLLDMANKELLKRERQIERLKGLLQEAKRIVQMAVSLDRDHHPVMFDEATAFIEKVTKELQ